MCVPCNWFSGIGLGLLKVQSSEKEQAIRITECEFCDSSVSQKSEWTEI